MTLNISSWNTYNMNKSQVNFATDKEDRNTIKKTKNDNNI